MLLLLFLYLSENAFSDGNYTFWDGFTVLKCKSSRHGNWNKQKNIWYFIYLLNYLGFEMVFHKWSFHRVASRSISVYCFTRCPLQTLSTNEINLAGSTLKYNICIRKSLITRFIHTFDTIGQQKNPAYFFRVYFLNYPVLWRTKTADFMRAVVGLLYIVHLQSLD